MRCWTSAWCDVLISRTVAEGIRAGRIRTQYRRWDAPRVRVGGQQLTPAGIVEFTRVTRVNDLSRLTDTAARAAGMRDAAALRRALAPRDRPRGERGSRGGAYVYRVHLRWVGEDPRIALREQIPDEAGLVEIATQLRRLDARRTGAWTTGILTWIRANPRVVSTVLAAERGVEVLPMKADIRKLKALGLTISHDVGYEISPRGRAYLDWVQSRVPDRRDGQG